jgi:membrane fusion protein (multidrug efflux system)
MKFLSIAPIFSMFLVLVLCGCGSHSESHDSAHGDSHDAAEAHGEAEHEHVILVTSPVKRDVISTQQYVCQIHSCQHIEVAALEEGYVQEIHVKEGQSVKKGELMFKIMPVLYQARLDSEIAEANRVQIELDNAERLSKKGIVSDQEIALKMAELAKAKAKVALAQAELSFTDFKAPFDGIVDRQRHQLGSLVEEGDVLSTFSDNSTMWVYFNVPEARYLEYKAELDKEKAERASRDDDQDEDADDEDADDDDSDEQNSAHPDHLQIELKLANSKIFGQPGKIGAIEADFNNTTGNIAFRADFPNPDGLLRNGQTGTILIHRVLKDAIVIPQRATFEILDKRYAYVIDKDNIVHQRDITILTEQEDIFVVGSGLKEGDKIVLEGIRQVRDGVEAEYEFKAPEEVLKNLKYHAE